MREREKEKEKEKEREKERKKERGSECEWERGRNWERFLASDAIPISTSSLPTE